MSIRDCQGSSKAQFEDKTCLFAVPYRTKILLPLCFLKLLVGCSMWYLMVVLHCPVSWGLSPSSQENRPLLLHGSSLWCVNDPEFGGVLGCCPWGAEGCGLVVPGSVLSCGTHWLQESNFSKFFSCHSWATVKNHTEIGKCWCDSEEESKTRVNHVAKIKGIMAIFTWLWCGRGLKFLILCPEAAQP